MKDQYTCMCENKIKMIINLITYQADGYSHIGVRQKVIVYYNNQRWWNETGLPVDFYIPIKYSLS